MKKLLLSSVVLLIFSCSILLFQVSCQKEAKANINNTTQNKIVYIKNNEEIRVSNFDGSNNNKVNIDLSAFTYIDIEDITINESGTKIIFEMNTNIDRSIYSCNIDGGGLSKIITNSGEVQGLTAF